MGPNFSPIIAFNESQVLAMGPLGEDDLHRKDYVQVLRAWVYQPASLTIPVPPTDDTPAAELLLWSPYDAAATDSSPAALRQGPGVCWMLPLPRITSTPFKTGRAFAVAVALISTKDDAEASPDQKKGRVIWWGHPIWVTSLGNSFDRAKGVLDELSADPLTEEDPYKGNPVYFDELTQDLLQYGPPTTP